MHALGHLLPYIIPFAIGWVMGKGSEKNAVAKAAKRLSGK